MKLNNLERVYIVARPSKKCKTPYVADIMLKNGNIVQAHCASLGCCGLCEKGCYVYASTIESNCKNTQSKVCSHKIYLSEFKEEKKLDENKPLILLNEQLIGVDPKLAETLVESAINSNFIDILQNVKSYKREVKYGNSRFDFSGIDENEREFILEVKNVPLCDYVDAPSKDRNLMEKTGAFKNLHFNEKISYFPDGYRKKKGAVVSERALKHINELKDLHLTTNVRSIICFVIQRTDSSYFQASNLDPIYQEAFYNAVDSGVEVVAFSVKWDKFGNASFIKNLQIKAVK